jgi:peroxiredoxin
MMEKRCQGIHRLHRLHRFRNANVLLMAFLILAVWRVGNADEPEASLVGRAAPLFRLQDPGGHRYALSDYRGRNVVVLFFCGCSWCADCAHAWAEMQRNGVLKPAATNAKSSRLASPVTLVVFAGGREETRAFAAQSRLDARQTLFLSDADQKVTLDAYKATVCPRAFVIDARGVVRYTNNHPEDAPRQAPAEAIVAQIITALRQLPTPPSNQTAPRRSDPHNKR